MAHAQQPQPHWPSTDQHQMLCPDCATLGKCLPLSEPSFSHFFWSSFSPLRVFSSHSLSICVSLIFPLESGSLCFHLPVSPFLSMSLFFFLSQLWNPASSRSVSEFEFLCHVSLSLFISYSLCLYSFLHLCFCCSISPSLFLCVSLSLCLFLCLS